MYNVYIFTYIYIHIYLYIFFSLYLYISNRNTLAQHVEYHTYHLIPHHILTLTSKKKVSKVSDERKMTKLR